MCWGGWRRLREEGGMEEGEGGGWGMWGIHDA